MEATGHYWRNLFAFLVEHGFGVVLLNPLRTRRFAEEELARTKTDAIDALGIAHFAAQKRPAATPVTGQLVDDLRETVRLREQLVSELGDALRQLHRALDLGFPEFTRHVRWLKGRLATAILARYPTARALANVSVRKLAALCYDGRNQVGSSLARRVIETAKNSVAQHHSEDYRLQVRLDTLARTSSGSAADSMRSRMRLSGSSMPTRSANCSPRLPASAPRLQPG
jgi:transposase